MKAIRDIEYKSVFAILLGAWMFLAVVFSTSLFSIGVRHTTVVRVAFVGAMLVADAAFDSKRYRSAKVFPRHALALAAALFVLVICASVREFWIPQVIAIAYCARNFEARYLIRVWLVACAGSVCFVLAACMIGVIPDFVTSSRGLFGRHSLGFSYSTYLSHYLLAMVAGYLYVVSFRPGVLSFLLMCVADFLVYVATDSRTSCILVLLLLLGCLVLRFATPRRGLGSRLLRLILGGIYVICFALSIAILVCLDPSSQFGGWANSVLSGRIDQSQRVLSEYGVGLLGQEIHWSTPHYLPDGSTVVGYLSPEGQLTPLPYMYVDNSYLNMLLVDGLVVFAVAMVLITSLAIWAVAADDLLLAICLAVFAIHSITDPQMMLLHYSPFLLLLGKPLFAPGTHAVRMEQKASSCFLRPYTV